LFDLGHRGRDRGEPARGAQLDRGSGVGRIGDALMPRPAAPVAGNLDAVAVHADLLEIRDHRDPTPNHTRVHRVVIGVEPDVMITRQPGGAAPARNGGNRWQRHHLGLVNGPAIDWTTAQPAVPAGIRPGQPVRELGVEVGR
jgi:hypothetical protein